MCSFGSLLEGATLAIRDHWRYLPLYLLLILSTMLCAGEQDESERLHGTVNVILGNRNGLVLATDSRLSSQGQGRGLGQKLFRVNDRVICAIAGFYSDSGPNLKSGGFPVHTTIPGILNRYLPGIEKSNMSLESMADLIGGALIFSLELVYNVNAAAGVPYHASPSQVTIAGYESENTPLKVIRFDLEPIRLSHITYTVTNWSRTTVTGELFVGFAGIDDVGRQMLSLTNPAQNADPNVDHYLKSMHADHGASLTIRDLEQLAEDVEYMTAKAHPGEVGGPLQMASLASGKILRLEQPIIGRGPDPIDGIIEFVTRNTFNGFFPSWIEPSETTIVFLKNNQFINVPNLSLDNKLFASNQFEHCRFTYKGGLTLLDTTNTISGNSLLVLADDVPDYSPFVANVKKSFPGLVIRRQKPKTLPN